MKAILAFVRLLRGSGGGGSGHWLFFAYWRKQAMKRDRAHTFHVGSVFLLTVYY